MSLRRLLPLRSGPVVKVCLSSSIDEIHYLLNPADDSGRPGVLKIMVLQDDTDRLLDLTSKLTQMGGIYQPIIYIVREQLQLKISILNSDNFAVLANV